jgi:hypothetical protein
MIGFIVECDTSKGPEVFQSIVKIVFLGCCIIWFPVHDEETALFPEIQGMACGRAGVQIVMNAK